PAKPVAALSHVAGKEDHGETATQRLKIFDDRLKELESIAKSAQDIPSKTPNPADAPFSLQPNALDRRLQALNAFDKELKQSSSLATNTPSSWQVVPPSQPVLIPKQDSSGPPLASLQPDTIVARVGDKTILYADIAPAVD